MSDTHTYSSDVAFTPAVKAIQARKGSRDAYARVEQNGGWRTEIDDDLAAFLAASGQPVSRDRQRGRPALLSSIAADPKVLSGFWTRTRLPSPTTAATGNTSRKAISAKIPKAHIFVMDYAHRRRVKIWGEARVVDDDPALLKSLMPVGYKARPEQVILFKISAWDTNCPQHIPQKFDAADVAAALASRDARIAELEAEVAKSEKRGIGSKLIALNHRDGDHRRLDKPAPARPAAPAARIQAIGRGSPPRTTPRWT